MKIRDALELIQGAVLLDDGSPVGAIWADLGAGSGTFTFALARLLGAAGRVVAVDREEAALDALRRGIRSRRTGPAGEGEGAAGAPVKGVASITPAMGDFRELDAVDALRGLTLDGALFANALHFDSDPGATLAGAAHRLQPGGRLVVVEYQDRPPNPWVPHPLPVARLREVAAGAGLGAPRMVGERPSSYGGVLYCAWLGSG